MLQDAYASSFSIYRAVASDSSVLRRLTFVPAVAPDAAAPTPGVHFTSLLNEPSTQKARMVDTEASALVLATGSALQPARELFKESAVELRWGAAMRVGAGLQNMGNTCFMNSVLQCLTHTPPLAQAVLGGAIKEVAADDVLTATACHIKRALSTTQVVAPRRHAQTLRQINKRFRLGRQEDSHEYLRCLLDAMQEACLQPYKPKPPQELAETTVINRIFGGKLRSRIKCHDVSYESSIYEDFMDLSLEVTRAPTLIRALQHFTAKEVLEGSNKYRCPRNNKLVKAYKQMSIETPPNVLTIHLKRFQFGGTGTKVTKHVEFPLELDLQPFMSHPGSGPQLYELYGVLVHLGHSVHAGHYYCFVRAGNGMWYKCDDSSVHQCAERQVLAQNAYILFYVRRYPRQLPVLNAANSRLGEGQGGQLSMLSSVQRPQTPPTPEAPRPAVKKASKLSTEAALQQLCSTAVHTERSVSIASVPGSAATIASLLLPKAAIAELNSSEQAGGLAGSSAAVMPRHQTRQQFGQSATTAEENGSSSSHDSSQGSEREVEGQRELAPHTPIRGGSPASWQRPKQPRMVHGLVYHGSRRLIGFLSAISSHASRDSRQRSFRRRLKPGPSLSTVSVASPCSKQVEEQQPCAASVLLEQQDRVPSDRRAANGLREPASSHKPASKGPVQPVFVASDAVPLPHRLPQLKQQWSRRGVCSQASQSKHLRHPPIQPGLLPGPSSSSRAYLEQSPELLGGPGRAFTERPAAQVVTGLAAAYLLASPAAGPGSVTAHREGGNPLKSAASQGVLTSSWEDADPDLAHAAQNLTRMQSHPRQRHREAWDEEYDRGKTKKIRRHLPAGSDLHRHGNAFQRHAESRGGQAGGAAYSENEAGRGRSGRRASRGGARGSAQGRGRGGRVGSGRGGTRSRR